MFSTYHLVPLTSIFYQIACISKTWFYHIFQNISEKIASFQFCLTLAEGQIISKAILKFSFESKIERKYSSIYALGL